VRSEHHARVGANVTFAGYIGERGREKVYEKERVRVIESIYI